MSWSVSWYVSLAVSLTACKPFIYRGFAVSLSVSLVVSLAVPLAVPLCSQKGRAAHREAAAAAAPAALAAGSAVLAAGRAAHREATAAAGRAVLAAALAAHREAAAAAGGRAGWVWLLAGRPAWRLRAGRPAWRLRAGRGARLAAPPLRSGDRGAVRVGFRLRACAPSRLAVVGRSVGSSRAVLGAASRPDPPYGPSRPGRCPCARARLALPSSLLRPAARCSALRLHPPQNDSPCPLHYAPGQPATAPQPARSPQARLPARSPQARLPASSHTQPARPPESASIPRPRALPLC